MLKITKNRKSVFDKKNIIMASLPVVQAPPNFSKMLVNKKKIIRICPLPPKLGEPTFSKFTQNLLSSLKFSLLS